MDSGTHPADLLILAAFPPELAALRPRLGPELAGHVGRRSVRAATVGIGLSAAAVGAARRIAAIRPRAAVLVGTCGAYAEGQGLRLGGVVVGNRVRLVDPAAVEGRAAFPEPMELTLEADPGLRQGLAAIAGAPLVDVATTLAITTDDPLTRAIASSGIAHVEHLEAHGVAAACAAEGVAFAAVLGIANAVGGNAREQWRAHHREAGDAAVAAVLAWLDAGAPGLPASAMPDE